MSKGSDQDYKPAQQGRKLKEYAADRPRRATRKEVDYKEVQIVLESDEETEPTTQGVVRRGVVRRIAEREIRDCSLESVWGGSRTESWSPQTAQRKTNKVVEGLREVQQQLTMAEKEEVSMTDLLAMMLEMGRKDKEEARKREEEREERTIEREDKRLREQADRENERLRQEEQREERRLQNIKDREDERRREGDIREERRLQNIRDREEERRREDDIREERAAEREVKLLATLKAAQPAVPQTVHLDSTKLPTMTKGEDIELFIELFESALSAGGVPPEKWVPKLHASLDTDTKLSIKETITAPGVAYDDIRNALIGQTHLTFAAASESLFSFEQGSILRLPVRQAVQKVARLYEKINKEATSMRDMCLYSAVAALRVALTKDVKQYIDVKGACEWNSFCSALEEWQKTNPGRHIWESKSKFTTDKHTFPFRQPFRPAAQMRRPGECFQCGKPGHFAAECRSRPAGERQPFFRQETPAPTQLPAARPEGSKPTRGFQRPLADTTCFHCHQKGHISPNCPVKKTVKKVRIMEDRIANLKSNEVFGSIGPHRMPITLDTGAEVSVVLEEAVEPHQFTGKERTIKSFNNTESIGKVCVIQITVGDQVLTKEAVTQPGISLDWSACLSFDLKDAEERDVLTRQIEQRAGLSQIDTLYVPPEVREGILVSGVLVKEAKIVKTVRSKIVNKVQVPVPAATAEAPESERVQQLEVQSEQEERDDGSINAELGTKDDEGERDEVAVTTVEGKSDGALVMEEVEDGSSGGSADRVEFPVVSIREGMPRREMAMETATDTSLHAVRKLAEQKKEGFHLSQGLIWRTRLDTVGKPVEQLCVPNSFRSKCLTAAHNNFGHQGRNKMVKLLKPYFYWPNQSRTCRDHVRQCSRCQAADKSNPKPQSMTVRPVVTQPFKDVAIDLVGPFPTAMGGFQHMLTCVDTATRWPEAIPIRSTTSRNIIKCLTETFARTEFPEKLTSDNGPQFVSKEFTSWLKRNGIAHSKSTPYHPQGNGVVERLHRTLNAMVLKTIESRGNWARVLPFALYFIRCTPSASTGVSPFMLTHGWEPSTPLQVLYQSWVKQDLENVNLADWVLENQERVENARDQATSNLLTASIKRSEAWDSRAVDRHFEVGDKVWMRKPALDHKVQESWMGPCTVVKKNSPVSYSIQTAQRLIPTVHVQQLKTDYNTEQVKKITAVVEDTPQDELSKSFAASKVQAQELTLQQQQQLQEVLRTYDDVLTKDPGLTTVTTFDIDTGEAEPVQQRPYSTPVTLKDSVDKELAWLLGKGYIIPSSSPWSSPMVTVRKTDGSARICVDFRRVNSLTRQIPFFMPRVEEVIEGIGKACYISKLDLSKGFYQVQLTDAAKEKTAFTCHKGAFHFTRMPFGVKNVPACFQALMQKVLSELGEFATAYMDDVVIFSPTWEDHVVHVDRVLQAIRGAGLTVNPSKCCWGGQSVEFLGHYVGHGSMSIPSHRTTALENYTRPRSKRGLRAFLGSVGFYRRYLPKLADWTSVLTPMTSKQAPQTVEWKEDGMSAFDCIRSFFCATPNLCVPLPNDTVSIVSDASGRGVGGVLQVYRQGEWTPSAYYSRQLRGAEARYSATELEALALVETVRHFAYHLYGREFITYTDHRPLEQLLSSNRLNPRLARMAYKLQHWLIKIQRGIGEHNHLRS